VQVPEGIPVKRAFGVKVDSSGKVVAFGYEFHLTIGELRKLPHGRWHAIATPPAARGARDLLDSPVDRPELAIEALVRHAGLRGEYSVRHL
jgi:hypothetical protein